MSEKLACGRLRWKGAFFHTKKPCTCLGTHWSGLLHPFLWHIPRLLTPYVCNNIFLGGGRIAKHKHCLVLQPLRLKSLWHFAYFCHLPGTWQKELSLKECFFSVLEARYWISTEVSSSGGNGSYREQALWHHFPLPKLCPPETLPPNLLEFFTALLMILWIADH